MASDHVCGAASPGPAVTGRQPDRSALTARPVLTPDPALADRFRGSLYAAEQEQHQ